MRTKRQPVDTILVSDILAAARRKLDAADDSDAPIEGLAVDALLALVRSDILDDLIEAYDNQHSCPICGANCKECECVEKRLEAAVGLHDVCKRLVAMYDPVAAFAAGHIDGTIHDTFVQLGQAVKEFTDVTTYKPDEEG